MRKSRVAPLGTSTSGASVASATRPAESRSFKYSSLLVSQRPHYFLPVPSCAEKSHHKTLTCACRIGSINSAKLFPAPAEPPPITMSAGLAKKFSWKPRCGLIKFRLLTAQNIHRSFKLLSGLSLFVISTKILFLNSHWRSGFRYLRGLC